MTKRQRENEFKKIIKSWSPEEKKRREQEYYNSLVEQLEIKEK